MIQVPEALNKMKKERTDGFNLFPVAIMVFLMLSFLAAIGYVLISSLP